MDVAQLVTGMLIAKRAAATKELKVMALVLLLVTVMLCAALVAFDATCPKSSWVAGLMVNTGTTCALTVAPCGLALALLAILTVPVAAPNALALNCTITVQLVLAATAPAAGQLPPAVPTGRLKPVPDTVTLEIVNIDVLVLA